MRSNAACSLLALATAVAVSIDIQTGTSDTVVQQIALWIRHHVEPAFPYPTAGTKAQRAAAEKMRAAAEKTRIAKDAKGAAAKKMDAAKQTEIAAKQMGAANDAAIKQAAGEALRAAAGAQREAEKEMRDAENAAGVAAALIHAAERAQRVAANNAAEELPRGPVRYEHYLRLPSMGMHTDPVAKLLFHPHGYFLTWAIYLMYLTSFQKVCFRADISKKPRYLSLTQARLGLAGFALVHFCMAAFTVIRHSAPSAFYLQIGPWWVRGDVCGWLFLAPWFLLVAVHWPYWRTIKRAAFRDERNDRATPRIGLFKKTLADQWEIQVEAEHAGGGKTVDAADDAGFTFLQYGWQDGEGKVEHWNFAATVPRRSPQTICVQIAQRTDGKLVLRAAYINTDGERGDWSERIPAQES
jgi:hypothetical protein